MSYATNKLNHINGGTATLRRFGYFDNVQLVHEFKNDRGRKRYYGPMRRIVIRADHNGDEVRFVADVTLWGKTKKSAVTVELDVLRAFEVDPVNRADIDVAAAMVHCKRYNQIGWALFHWWSQYQEIAFQTMTWSPSMTFKVWAEEREAIHAQLRKMKPLKRRGQMVTVKHQMLTYGMLKQHEHQIAELREELRPGLTVGTLVPSAVMQWTVEGMRMSGTIKGAFCS